MNLLYHVIVSDSGTCEPLVCLLIG